MIRNSTPRTRRRSPSFTRHEWRAILGIALAAPLTACAPSAATLRSTPGTVAADSAIRVALAQESTLDANSFAAGTVGVLPLRIASADSSLAPLGYGLAELLMTDLARSSQITVVDRLRIHALLREQSLAQSARADTASGPRLGRILGARQLVQGQVASTDERVLRIDARLARTDNGTVKAVDGGNAGIDEILDAEKALAFRIFEGMGVTLTPAERAAIEQRPTRSLGALLAFSKGVRAEGELRFGEAQQAYREATRHDPSFRQAQDRLASISAAAPETLGVGTMAVDALNRPHLPPSNDVSEPAFRSQQKAILIIQINIP